MRIPPEILASSFGRMEQGERLCKSLDRLMYLSGKLGRATMLT
jgi:hypothetical protein